MSSVMQNGGHMTQLHVASTSQWMEIQRNTFKNWVNEQLKSRGHSIFDIRTDFDDGVLLVALVEILQRKKIGGAVQHPNHKHEKLHNITIALDAIAKDNVSLINIDSTHITEGNTKLILALLWQLVCRYQVGLSNLEQRRWLLAWIQAVIPDCHVSNLTSDWNSGVALHALLEFCKKGLSPNWRQLNPLDRTNNCRDAMKLARQHFGIPLILRPEDLANSNLDELSAITYLSYFTKVGAPGYNGTLQRMQPLVKDHPVFNFTTDWNDGRVLCELVTVFGGTIPSWPELRGTNIQRIDEGLQGASELGVTPILTAPDIAKESHEHLGNMAYAARFLHMTQDVVTYEQTKIITVEESLGPTRTSTLNTSYMNSMNSMNGDITNRTRRDSSSSDSTINESKHNQLEYTLVRTPSLRRKQKTRGALNISEGIKKDTYSDGVIIYATSHDVVTPDDIRLEAESPTGRLVKMNGDGMYHAQFGPDEIGTWSVTLLINNRIVDSCRVDVCDPSQVKVSGLKAGMAGNTHKFMVDCTNAGDGKLEVDIQQDSKHVPCFLTKKSNKIYSASFTPIASGQYKVGVSYNKAEIRDDAMSGPGVEELHRQAIFSTKMEPHYDHYKITAACDWQIDYMTGGPIDLYIGDTADVRVYSMQDGTVCNTPHLIADCTNAPSGVPIEAEVSYGSYRFPAEVSEDPEKPGLYRIVFNPRGPGTYKVWIIYGGRLVKGSPFLQEIDELTAPSVKGPGLSKGTVGDPAEFTIDARGFPGHVTVEVKGPHFPINATVNKNPDNTHTVTYVPEEIGIHRINIKLDDKDIKGSPYHPKIVDPTKIRVSGGWNSLLDDQDRIPLQVKKEKHIPFDASEAGPGELTATVTGPSEKIPVTIDSRGDGKHTVIFTPKEIGKHYIDVYWNGFALDRTPYLGYATPARDEPDYIIEPTMHVKYEQPVETRREPIQRTAPNRNSEPPGSYWVRADQRPIHDNGPAKVYVVAPAKSEPAIPDIHSTMYPPTRIRVHRHGSDITPSSKPRYLQPKRTPSHYSGSTVSVISEPNKQKGPDITITRLPRVSPMYTYDTPTPSESYIYQTSPMSSSPPSVSPSYIYAKPIKKRNDEPDGSGASPKVVLRGHGLKEAEVDKPAVFTIDGRNAGPGFVPIVCLRKCGEADDTHNVSSISNISSIKNSFRVGADRHVSFDENWDVSFWEDENGGEPEAKISSIRSEPPIEIKPTGPKQYKCTYVPRVPGAYLLDIKWNNKQLKCCPFKIDVHKRVYPEKVGVSGPHLKGGVLGKDIDLKIDPRDAGQGEITIDCVDPYGNDVPVNLTDNYDGTYRLRVKPVKLGKHILNIRLNKQHVFGSPYAIEIKPDRPTLGPVKVWGPGLTNGVFPDYQGHFYVDATGAGGGELHVSVMGLKGAFHVEMKRASQKDKLFNCLYHPVEPGMYTINIQWSGVHVEGSPYKVFVAGSEMELVDHENRSPRSSARSSSKQSPNTTQNSIMY